MPLDSPAISRRHAEFRFDRGRFFIRDLGSASGTFVNGVRVYGPQVLTRGDLVHIGTYQFRFNGRQLVSMQAERGARIVVRSLGKRVRSRDTGRLAWILEDIDMTVAPREFVGILGTSGSGKSTLSDALNGRRPASTGTVMYNDCDLYQQFDAIKKDIGYVPQELILHQGLPVSDALRYACKLRLPPDVRDEEIEANIQRVLKIVQLSERGSTQISRLSGGQKKRVAVAVELLSKPTVLFLDEATSGLDHVTEGEMMKLFRSVADRGTTTLCVTHFADSLEICDKVAFLIKGQLAYYGPPAEMKRYFGVEAIREVLHRQGEKTPPEWNAQFKKSPLYAKYAMDQTKPAAEAGAASKLRPTQKRGLLTSCRQFAVLTKRGVQLQFTEWRTLLVLLALPMAIAVMTGLSQPKPPEFEHVKDLMENGSLAITYEETPLDQEKKISREQGRQHNWMSILAVSAFFLGLFGSIREIVKEKDIYRHERFNGLGISPYLASKIVCLAPVGIAQAGTLLIFTHLSAHLLLFGPTKPLLQAGEIILLGIFTAQLLGLAISALVNTESMAVVLMVVLVIPQILFSGMLPRLMSDWTDILARFLICTYWSLSGLECQLANYAIASESRDISMQDCVIVLMGFALFYVVLGALFLKLRDSQNSSLSRRAERIRRAVATRIMEAASD